MAVSRLAYPCEWSCPDCRTVCGCHEPDGIHIRCGYGGEVMGPQEDPDPRSDMYGLWDSAEYRSGSPDTEILGRQP
jgi:hypothetical protein